jgi:Zyg-11 family protein
MFVYDKLVRILLESLGSYIPPLGALAGANDPQDFNERIAIYLLNSLACQVEGEHKRLVGRLGAIQKMLGLIRTRLAREDCDDVMEIAWSTMWNVTDETAENCSKFLEHDGMALFLQCLTAFPNQPELLRNMMGMQN